MNNINDYITEKLRIGKSINIKTVEPISKYNELMKSEYEIHSIQTGNYKWDYIITFKNTVVKHFEKFFELYEEQQIAFAQKCFDELPIKTQLDRNKNYIHLYHDETGFVISYKIDDGDYALSINIDNPDYHIKHTCIINVYYDNNYKNDTLNYLNVLIYNLVNENFK